MHCGALFVLFCFLFLSTCPPRRGRGRVAAGRGGAERGGAGRRDAGAAPRACGVRPAGGPVALPKAARPAGSARAAPGPGSAGDPEGGGRRGLDRDQTRGSHTPSARLPGAALHVTDSGGAERFRDRGPRLRLTPARERRGAFGLWPPAQVAFRPEQVEGRVGVAGWAARGPERARAVGPRRGRRLPRGLGPAPPVPPAPGAPGAARRRPTAPAEAAVGLWLCPCNHTSALASSPRSESRGGDGVCAPFLSPGGPGPSQRRRAAAAETRVPMWLKRCPRPAPGRPRKVSRARAQGGWPSSATAPWARRASALPCARRESSPGPALENWPLQVSSGPSPKAARARGPAFSPPGSRLGRYSIFLKDALRSTLF